MPLGLGQHAFAGVDQDHGEVGVGGAGGHVAGVLLVPGGVGDDEGAPVGGEEPVGDVDGDPLLPLGLQAVDEQGEIEVVPRGAMAGAVAGQGGQLVVEDQLGIVEKPADQGRLAVVHRAAGQKSQQAFLVVGQGRTRRRAGRRGRVAH